ncbi:hypothetical protein ACQPZG_02495 (plasmid) [Streptomyces sp. CA-294286]|uniref:hypothetical protein n=1 Tax=Streptomyces sp. CA-294286 TaxID=3240070 RepID=UPI003D8C39D2
MFGELWDRAAHLLMLAVGVGCAWLGCATVLRPRRARPGIPGPAWGARTWGVGYVLLGVSLTVQEVCRMAGEELMWPSGLVRWVAGPLIVTSLLAGIAWRGWGRHEARRGDGRREA